jgi:hypothetical protein
MTLASWAIGVVALLIFEAWEMSDRGDGKHRCLVFVKK